MLIPPSATMFCPVTNEEAGIAKNATILAISFA